MGRGGRTSSKCRSRKEVWTKRRDSDDSDEDYLLEDDEIGEQSEELESLVADDSEEESFCSFEEEEEEEEGEDEEDDEYECEEEEDEDEYEEIEVEVKKAEKSKARKESSKPREKRIKRSKKRKRFIDEEEDEEYDEDDEEFTPNEFDCLDEEEELPFLKRENKSRGRPALKKKDTAKRRRRKTGAKVVRKSLKKKRKNGSSLRRKAYSGINEDSMGDIPVLRGKTKKKATGRKRNRMACSDSDFVSSESSDYEFTISEEEREQVREANEICRSLSTNLRSSKRIKEDAALCQPRKLPRRKGKEKADDIKNEGGKQVCGICLTEEGKNTVRGTLNCCSHYFCFTCIMEWSKVETRCPLCKQRFVTISKPARCVTGIDLRNVVIQVPERDQVYQPSEEELRDYLDPYENVICIECHQGGDDALMLLCDLCDSPAHTYCVGLGREVPEGNWYCVDCRPSALGSSFSQVQDQTPDQRTIRNISDGPSSFENMADIDLNVTIPETPLTQGNGFVSSPRYPGGNPSPVSGAGVSTVFGRRRIHRLHYLLSSNRMNQMAARVDRGSGSDLRGDISSAQIDRGIESTYQQTRAPEVGTSQHTSYIGRLQQDCPSSSVQSRDLFAGRLSHARAQAVQLPNSVDSSAHHDMHSGRIHGILLGLNRTPGYEPLQPCSSISNIVYDTGVSTPYNIDGDHTSIARQQLQAMVKSHLKSLSKDMELGCSTFIDIANSSTQAILAACGIEHRRSEVYEVQAPFCVHSEGSADGQMRFMKGCCPSCFDSFVKDVVRKIMDIRVPQWLGFRH